ncbi:MAG: stalk domain-containing protein [Fimbriimonas sp.]
MSHLQPRNFAITSRAWTALVASVALAGFASAQDIGVTVNGETVRFAGVGPQRVNGRVMVPLRGVMERLGAYVSYNAAGRTVTATRGDVDLQLRIGDRIATVNGRQVTLDVPAQEYQGSTLVPLRFMGEALGADVRWDGAVQAVVITTGDADGRPQPIPGNPGNSGNSGSVDIASFSADQDGYLRAGAKVVYTLEGTPGGTAVLQIPNVVQELPMREVSPGRYQATLTVPNDRLNVNQGSALARLKIGASEKLIQAGSPVRIDTQAPMISESTPAADARINRPRPNITVTFDDAGGSGIDPATVKLSIDGRDVTDDATVTASLLAFRPIQPLAAGRHEVEITAHDKAGNRTRKAWAFTVASRNEVIRNFTHDAEGEVRPGQVITFTLLGEPGGTATYTVGNRLRKRAMTEVEPGKYVGEYTVRQNDEFESEKVVAELKTKDGETFTFDAPNQLAANVVPAMPTITSPTADEALGRTLIVRGKARAGQQVRVRVDYKGNALGVIALNGSIGEQTVQADAQGNWETTAFNLDSLATRRGTTFTIRAVSLGSNGRESEARTVSAKRG